MQVHFELSNQLPLFRRAVVTIGTFDGVHLGHQQIIQQLKEESKAIDGESIIITFDPHPRMIISEIPGEIKVLTHLNEKIDLLAKTGIDHLVVVPFNVGFANLTPEEYVKDFLFAHFKPHTIIIGYDHRFGKDRAGDFQLMENMGKQLGFLVKEIAAQNIHQIAISSTRIRKALFANQVALANELLGYPYFFEGLVEKGNQLGRTLGFPTANLSINKLEKLIPANGVYAVNILYQERKWQGMMNIGFRPTVDGKKKIIEVHIFNFNNDIYGNLLKIELIHFVRNEIKFESIDALKNQLAEDQKKVAKLLAN